MPRSDVPFTPFSKDGNCMTRGRAGQPQNHNIWWSEEYDPHRILGSVGGDVYDLWTGCGVGVERCCGASRGLLGDAHTDAVAGSDAAQIWCREGGADSGRSGIGLCARWHNPWSERAEVADTIPVVNIRAGRWHPRWVAYLAKGPGEL